MQRRGLYWHWCTVCRLASPHMAARFSQQEDHAGSYVPACLPRDPIFLALPLDYVSTATGPRLCQKSVTSLGTSGCMTCSCTSLLVCSGRHGSSVQIGAPEVRAETDPWTMMQIYSRKHMCVLFRAGCSKYKTHQRWEALVSPWPGPDMASKHDCMIDTTNIKCICNIQCYYIKDVKASTRYMS